MPTLEEVRVAQEFLNYCETVRRRHGGNPHTDLEKKAIAVVGKYLSEKEADISDDGGIITKIKGGKVSTRRFKAVRCSLNAIVESLKSAGVIPEDAETDNAAVTFWDVCMGPDVKNERPELLIRFEHPTFESIAEYHDCPVRYVSLAVSEK